MVNSAVANLPSRPTKASSDSKANYGRLEPSRPQAKWAPIARGFACLKGVHGRKVAERPPRCGARAVFAALAKECPSHPADADAKHKPGDLAVPIVTAS